METFLAYLKIPAIAGFVGGIVSFRFIDELTWSKRVATAFTGALIAHFGTPVASFYFEMHDKYEPSIGFLLGLFGMSLVAASIQTIPKIAAAFTTRFGGNT